MARRAELKRIMHKRIQEELKSEEEQPEPSTGSASGVKYSTTPIDFPGGGPRDHLEFSIANASLADAEARKDAADEQSNAVDEPIKDERDKDYPSKEIVRLPTPEIPSTGSESRNATTSLHGLQLSPFRWLGTDGDSFLKGSDNLVLERTAAAGYSDAIMTDLQLGSRSFSGKFGKAVKTGLEKLLPPKSGPLDEAGRSLSGHVALAGKRLEYPELEVLPTEGGYKELKALEQGIDIVKNRHLELPTRATATDMRKRSMSHTIPILGGREQGNKSQLIRTA
ncbi:hypothetical protein HYQ46_004327 [Verticillium longisporum]|nr:hypothetical protein HYQ46_004327 [Verticillium longisporum]